MGVILGRIIAAAVGQALFFSAFQTDVVEEWGSLDTSENLGKPFGGGKLLLQIAV